MPAGSPSAFTRAADAVLAQLSEAVPFAMWVVSRRSDDAYVVIAARDREYGVVQGDVLPWESTLCARMVDGSAPQAAGDIADVPVWMTAAAGLRMDVGAYVTVPLTSSTGELYGTLCGADPGRRAGDLEPELEHVRRAALVLTVLLEQQLDLQRALRATEAWHDAAHRDALTGLGNRRLWDDALSRVEEQRAGLGSRAAVVVVDVDGLKRVNDELGHSVGDVLLARAADVLRSQLRDDDVVARTGGDEFGVLLVDPGPGAAESLVERLRSALSAVDVEASCGVATTGGDLQLEQVWERADAAMYADKRARTNRTPRPAVAPSRRTPGPRSVPSCDPAEPQVSALLAQARSLLGLPVAFVSRFHDDLRVIEAVDASCPVSLVAGVGHPAEDTYCQRIVDGRLPQAIPDTAANGVTAGLAVTQELGIGSYVGVPIALDDRSVYGTLCAFAPDARPVDDRDVAVLQLIANTIGAQLSARAEADGMVAEVAQRVRDVVDRGRISSVFQAVVDLRTGRVVAVEGLSRFPAEYGRRPDEWFRDAASVGRGTALELAAAHSAVSALARLPRDVAVSVNVSPGVVRDPVFTAWLADAPVERIVLELTEHDQIDDYDGLTAALAPARARGMRLAVDDAGAGYASMRHILNLKPDVLKLDMSLVRGVDTDADKRAACRAIVTFAHDTGARVVAEGVETRAELTAVQALAADFAQGYALHRPQPLADLRLDGHLELGADAGPLGAAARLPRPRRPAPASTPAGRTAAGG